MKSKKLRITVLVSALLLNTVCCAMSMSNDGNILRIIGSFLAFFAVAVVTWKLPLAVGISTYAFVFLASSLGSVLEVYTKIEVYDRIVHYLSGIVLALAGYYIAKLIFEKKQVTENGDFVKDTFAFLFSSACAAFWEIYEFTVDNLLGMESQGDNLNTMGDIVAGVLGAVTYIVLKLVIIIIKRSKNNR